eukprot:7211206-Pyramimonas_sp.AAC.1
MHPVFPAASRAPFPSFCCGVPCCPQGSPSCPLVPSCAFCCNRRNEGTTGDTSGFPGGQQGAAGDT